jgi:hypothetical protein
MGLFLLRFDDESVFMKHSTYFEKTQHAVAAILSVRTVKIICLNSDFLVQFVTI